MNENSKKRTITTKEIWRLESNETTKSEFNLIRVPSDVTFFQDTKFLVADSVGHGIFLFCPGDYANDENFKNNPNVIVDRKSLDKKIGERNGYKFKKLFSEEVWPNCLVVLPDDKIRVTDRKTKSIKTFDINTEQLISDWACSEEDSHGSVQINGIAYSTRKQTIVTNTAQHCIQVYDDNGDIIKTFGSRGDLLHHLRLPFYVTTDTKDHILVSDNMNYCVKIFDMEGNFINRIGSGNLFGNRQFQSPYGVAVSEHSDEIYVADHDSNKIFVYDKAGQFIGYGASGPICESPCGISVNEDCGLIVVTLSNPNFSNVKLFKIEQ